MANPDEQDELIVNSVPSVLLQGDQEKLVDDDYSRQCKRNVAQDVERGVVCCASAGRARSVARSQQCRRSPSTRSSLVVCWRCLKKLMVKLTDELRELASELEHSPEPSAVSTEPGCVHPAGQDAVGCRSVQTELARRTRGKAEHSTTLSQLASRILQLPSSARELEDLITDLINRLHVKTPSEDRAIEKVWQDITQLSRDQDVRSEDYVGRFHIVLDSLAVRLCEDAEFATKVQDAKHNQAPSHMTTITEGLESKLRDEIKTTG